MVGKNLFPVCVLPFAIVYYVLCLTEAFKFEEVLFINVCLSVYAIGLMFRTQSPIPICLRGPPNFSPETFSVTGFILRSLIHLDLSFVHSDIHGSICSLLFNIFQLCQHHLLKMLLFWFSNDQDKQLGWIVVYSGRNNNIGKWTPAGSTGSSPLGVPPARQSLQLPLILSPQVRAIPVSTPNGRCLSHRCKQSEYLITIPHLV